MLSRILKMLLAQSANVVVILITQALLPPIFLHSYGVAPYGEWLVLSATVAYLANLNFGIATYAANELTILRQRGDDEQYRRLQGSTLALMLFLVGVGLLASAGVSLLPLTRLLHLHSIGRRDAGLTALFLGLQMTVHIIVGYYNNLFMVVQETHRGTMWWNARRLAGTLVAALLALLRCSFAANALGQFAAVLLVALLTIFDLQRRMRGLPLGLQGANWQTARAALKPSGMFGMVFMQTFLLFQVPVLLLQRILGPEVVVLFTISRTVLGTARQMLSILTNAIAPEITFSFGSGDMKKLLDIFHYSERLVFSLIPLFNLGAYLFSPLLLVIWLHKPDLFQQDTYVLMVLISAAMSVREHKVFFQYSTNTHYALAHIIFWGNLAMIATSIPMTIWLRLDGFLYTWLTSEIVLMVLIYRENRKLFANDSSITLAPVLRLIAFIGVALPLCVPVLNYGRRHSLLSVSLIAIGSTAVVFAASWFVFGLGALRERAMARFAAR
jgi:O-antigen/teichoic acid export membrane protein